MSTPADELRAYREREGISQAELARRLGLRGKHAAGTIGAAERGQRPASRPMLEKLRRLAGAPSPPPPTEPSPLAAGEEPLLTGDLPPLPEQPGDESEDEESIVYQAKAGGKTITVRSLGHFGRIELSMFVFFAGKDIQYASPTPDGRIETLVTHQPGLADFLPNARDGAVIREHAAEMAHAWAEWARTSPRVNGLLSFFVLEGGAKGVAAASFPVILAILSNHGIDPIRFFLGPLHPEQLGGAPEQTVEPAAAAADGPLS